MHFWKDDIGNIQHGDHFGQKPVLENLKTAAEGMEPPACLALYGDWGSGKTTVLHALYTDWVYAGRSAVWFDPWIFERTDDLVLPLLAEVTRVIEKQSSAASWDAKKKKAWNAVKTGFWTAVRIGLGAFAHKDNAWKGAAGQATKETPITDYEARARRYDAVLAIRDRFREMAAYVENGPLLICLDDLDRCLPASVVELLEAVKLVLCGLGTITGGDVGKTGEAHAKAEPANVVFVFALDRTLVGEAIRKQYGDASLYTGENYLEKIFDLSFEAPPIEAEVLASYLEQLIGEGGNRIAAAFGQGSIETAKMRLATAIIESRLTNPRVLKRAFNRINLLLRDDERRDHVGRICRNAESAGRFIAWTIGVERFRTFRHFLLRAGEGDLLALDVLLEQKHQAGVTAEARAFFDTPGFISFANIVAPTGFRPQARRTGNTLAEFDLILRKAGL